MFFCKNHERDRFSFVGYPDGDPGIILLLNCCCPTNVPRFIIAIIVNAVNTISRTRAGANIIIKIFKGMSPAVTDFYSTPAIIRETASFRIDATIYETVPSFDFRDFG